MKKIIAGLALSVALLPVGAQANELVFGVKGGIHQIDLSAYDPAAMVSAQISYEFLDLAAVDVALELEAGKTISDAKVDFGPAPGDQTDAEVTTIGAYISVRTAGPVYAIGRIGVANTDVSFEDKANFTDGDDTGVSAGAGVGFSLGVRTEIELTRYEVDKEQAYYLSLGVAF